MERRRLLPGAEVIFCSSFFPQTIARAIFSPLLHPSKDVAQCMLEMLRQGHRNRRGNHQPDGLRRLGTAADRLPGRLGRSAGRRILQGKELMAHPVLGDEEDRVFVISGEGQFGMCGIKSWYTSVACPADTFSPGEPSQISQ